VWRAASALETEWRAEWKTTSTNRRTLVRRLYLRAGGKWRPARNGEVEGETYAVIHTFTPEAAKLVEERGKHAIKRYVQSVLNRGQRRA
jgi:hypothetical protein